MKTSIFLSYAKEDVEFARRLHDELKELGFDVWVDFSKLKAGDRWKDRISDAIQGCRYFVAVISNNSVSKVGYVQKELKEGLDILEHHPSESIFIIPVRIDGAKPSERRLRELHWVDMFPNFDLGLLEFLKAIDLQPGRPFEHDISNTGWLFVDNDEDKRTCDEIQFFDDGSTRLKIVSQSMHVSGSDEGMQFMTTVGQWAQLGDGVTFRTYPDGPLHRGSIKYVEKNHYVLAKDPGLKIVSVGEPHFSAIFMRFTDKSRIGHELSYDPETGVSTNEYEMRGRMVFRRYQR